MAEKRYYWLKLFDDFFTSKRIKKLRNLAGGDTYTIIYLKMQLKALKDEGYLYFDGVMSDFAEELALDIDEKPEDVKITIQYLLSVGLLETNNDDIYKLTYMERVIGSETAHTQRQREYIKRKKEREASLNDAGVTQMLQVGDVDLEKEKDIEIDIDIEKEKKTTTKEKGQSIADLLSNSNLSDEVKLCLNEWIEYKKEQHKFSYKPIGFKKLLTEVENQEQEIGSVKVIKAMNLSMAKGYQGIIWDLVKDKKSGNSDYMDAVKNRVNVVDEWI